MAITPNEFKLFQTFLHDHSGIVIGPGKEYLLENRLTVLMTQNGCDTFLQFYNKIKATNALAVKVVDALTTNETLWFRDDSFYQALTDQIIPGLLNKAKTQPRVRIWSAASSTGQEPYSVAMLLDHVARRSNATALLGRFSILGTDISPSVIFMAKQGRYNQLAITRGMRPDFLSRYFVKAGMTYEMTPEIKKMTQFQLFNLKDPFTSLGTFDFVLCRNVLIYFSDELKKSIYDKMHRCLTPGGYLAIGASESPRAVTTAFKPVKMGQAYVYEPIR